MTNLRDHALSGLIACGKCVEAGYASENARMIGRYVTANPNPYNLTCEGKRGRKIIHRQYMVGVTLILPATMRKLQKLRDPKVADAVLSRWAAEALTDTSAKFRAKIGADIEVKRAEEAAIEKRADDAFAARNDPRLGVAAHAERVLARTEADRAANKAARAALELSLCELPAMQRREVLVGSLLHAAETMFDSRDGTFDEPQLAQATTVDEMLAAWRPSSVGSGFAKWVAAIGPPVYHGKRERRQGRRLASRMDLRWPFLDDVRPKDAPDYAFEPDLEWQESSL